MKGTVIKFSNIKFEDHKFYGETNFKRDKGVSVDGVCNTVYDIGIVVMLENF